MNKKVHHIIKSSGESQRFSASKLQKSLKRTGLRPKECSKIAKEITLKIHPGMKSKEIFKETVKLVRMHSQVAAIHYSLKKSLQELGPAGFEFEIFVSKYFEAIGFTTYVGVIMQGEFVTHEVDVIASKENYQVYAECKFHNNIGIKNDIKIALYVKARWDDLRNGPDGKYLKQFYLVSNTAFTTDAIKYANGSGLKLLGVNAPADESFLDKIKKYKLYPITSLKRLKKSYCLELINKKIILCTQLLVEEKLLIRMGLSEIEIKNIFDDIKHLMNYEKNYNKNDKRNYGY
jgi:hypothetical protein